MYFMTNVDKRIPTYSDAFDSFKDLGRLDFRRLQGPVFDPPRGMSAGSFSRTAAGNRA